MILEFSFKVKKYYEGNWPEWRGKGIYKRNALDSGTDEEMRIQNAPQLYRLEVSNTVHEQVFITNVVSLAHHFECSAVLISLHDNATDVK